MKIKNNLKILDCTLRDGGYYNNWDFSDKLVGKYVDGINKSNIDIVEVGFRFLKKDNLGKFSLTKESLLNKLKFKKDLSLAVMINGSDFLSKENYKNLIKKHFLKKKFSKISLIRIATHLRDIKKIIPHIKLLKNYGYNIALNLMQIDKVTNKDLKNLLRMLKKDNSVDVFYFADSFGNLSPKSVKKICNVIQSNWNKSFGFHAHDNCGLAFKNCLAAISQGAEWIDSTIQGMGRGAGNLKTEEILKYLKKKQINNYNTLPIVKIANTDFNKLKQKYNWGKSLYYYLSAKKNIHPSYIQEILADKRYNQKEILKIINHLSNIKSSSFNPIKLQNLLNENMNFKNCWNGLEWCKNKNILILGQGNSIKKHYNKILDFIDKKKCQVLSLNINKDMKDKYIKYYLACNETRIMIDYKQYLNFPKKTILPIGRISKVMKKNFPKEIKDFGMIVKKDRFNVSSNYCEIPNNLAISYALAISLIGKAKNIFLAGFDGYKKRKNLDIQMREFLSFLKKKHAYIKLKSVTPTNYNLKRV